MTQKIYVDVGSDITYFPIGRRGENEAREVVFDITSFKEEFGDGSASLMFRRPLEEAAYAVTVTRQDDKIHWVVSSTDTANDGEGRAELFWISNEVVVKSVVWGIIIENDIGATSDQPPAPVESWTARLVAVEDAVAHLDTEAVTRETARATAAEQANAAAISAETTRATAAEQANATAISAETTRAEGAESSLSDDISAETARAEGVEGTLSSLTTTAKSNLVAAINEVDASVDALNSNIAYSTGTYTVSAQCFGFITSTSAFATLNFVLPKIILPGLSITVTAITGAAIRCGGSYLVSNGATLTSYIGNVSARGQIVYVPLSKSDGFGVPNNYALAGLATVTFTLS